MRQGDGGEKQFLGYSARAGNYRPEKLLLQPARREAFGSVAEHMKNGELRDKLVFNN